MEIQVIIIIVFSNKINGNGQFNFICKSNKCRNAQFDWPKNAPKNNPWWQNFLAKWVGKLPNLWENRGTGNAGWIALLSHIRLEMKSSGLPKQFHKAFRFCYYVCIGFSFIHSFYTVLGSGICCYFVGTLCCNVNIVDLLLNLFQCWWCLLRHFTFRCDVSISLVYWERSALCISFRNVWTLFWKMS